MAETSDKKILIVDDDSVLLNMYKQQLENEGYQVYSAIDGEEALDIFKDEDFDLILCDIMLPKVSGIELIGKIRKLPKGKDVNIIAWSNLKKNEEEEKLKGFNVKEYLDKNSMSLADVASTVKKYT